MNCFNLLPKNASLINGVICIIDAQCRCALGQDDMEQYTLIGTSLFSIELLLFFLSANTRIYPECLFSIKLLLSVYL